LQIDVDASSSSGNEISTAHFAARRVWTAHCVDPATQLALPFDDQFLDFANLIPRAGVHRLQRAASPIPVEAQRP